MSELQGKPATPTAADELSFVEPKRIERVIDGRQLLIGPMEIGMLPKVLQLVEPCLAEIAQLFQEDVELLPRIQAGAMERQDWLDLLGLVGSHGEPVLRAMAVLAKVEQPWVLQLLPDRAAVLLADLVLVNADFFERALPSLPRLPRVAGMDEAAPA